MLVKSKPMEKDQWKVTTEKTCGYQLHSEIFRQKNETQDLVYGMTLKLLSHDGALLEEKTVGDITTNQEDIYRLDGLVHQLFVTPCTFADVVEDFIAT